MEIEISKIDAAVEQLDWAIRLILDHAAYVPAITLAAAAEEILGKAVGNSATFHVLKKKFAAEFAMEEKAVADGHLNLARNWLKHWDELAKDEDQKSRLTQKRCTTFCALSTIWFCSTDHFQSQGLNSTNGHELAPKPRSRTEAT